MIPTSRLAAARLFYFVGGLVLHLSNSMAAQSLLSPTDAVTVTPAPRQSIGGPAFEHWNGFKGQKNGVAELAVPGTAIFQCPAGKLGWNQQGLQLHNDSSLNWWSQYGVRFEIYLPASPATRTAIVTVTLKSPPPAYGNGQVLRETSARVRLAGQGWHTVTLPWSAFDFNRGQNSFLKFIREVGVRVQFEGGATGAVQFRNPRVIRAAAIALDTSVKGKSVAAGAIAHYDVTVGNASDEVRHIQLSFEKQGWEVLGTLVVPAELTLAPGASGRVDVAVHVPENVPPGAHETQKLLALSQGQGVGQGTILESLQLVTACDVPRPSIMHTPAEWAQIRDTVAHYDWAKKSQDTDYDKVADAWKVPEAPVPLGKLNEGHTYVFGPQDYITLEKVSVAWQLTRKREYAEKCALLLRRLADPVSGYPFARAVISQGQPQEGENMQRVAIAYDAILDADVLSPADRASIESTFRLYMADLAETELNNGNVGNWNVSMGTGAMFCALAMGDLSAVDRYIHGQTGVLDYVSKGIMDDGWWWEGSTTYNMWVSAELTQTALACRPWGIDLLNLQVPANYSPKTIINPMGTGPQQFGIKFENWGPRRRNTRSIKQLWDAVPAATDYRGVVIGLNDGHEDRVAGARMELAYYAFRDPMYAALIKLAPQRDLVYGVPELPADLPGLGSTSNTAENIGYSLLRSQTAGRAPREQIQAVLKSGSHGGFHGHFDRAALVNLTRYGRSFYNPESIWHGYASSLYKFYVQTSLSHNMVVVDGKMQESMEPSQPLFYAGRMLQAAAVETKARWSDPPYGGMVYQANETLAQRQWTNGQNYPIVTDRKWGELGPCSEPVTQRRLTVVTDDYVVLADSLQGTAPHTFDNLLQMKGFGGLEAPGKAFLRHDAQYDSDPHSSGQFITDANWYSAQAPAVGKFEFKYGLGADNAGTFFYCNEDGTLKVDVHSLWPAQQQIMVAMPPETHGENQRVTYALTGDGKVLTEGKSAMWVLGQQEIDVPVAGVQELALKITTEGGKKKGLFLANARLGLADGQEVPYAGGTISDGLEGPPAPGQDYYGGPIKIAGVPCAAAIGVQPKTPNSPATLHLPLRGAGLPEGAVRFRATLGSDYPFGDESQRRKVYAIRTSGTAARFLTIMEPYENTAMVRSATATGPDSLRVELADGRVQELTITGLDGDGRHIGVAITESRDGKVVRSEQAGAALRTKPETSAAR